MNATTSESLNQIPLWKIVAAAVLLGAVLNLFVLTSGAGVAAGIAAALLASRWRSLPPGKRILRAAGTGCLVGLLTFPVTLALGVCTGFAVGFCRGFCNGFLGIA